MTTGDTARGGGGQGSFLAARLLYPGPSSHHPHPGPGDPVVTARQDMPSQVEGTKGIFGQCARRGGGGRPAGRHGTTGALEASRGP